MLKFAVVTPIPTPYRDPFWNTVSRYEGIELHVFYCAQGKADRPWSASWTMEYKALFPEGKNLLSWWKSDKSLYWNPGVVESLKTEQYEAVIFGGYNHLTMLAGIYYCIRNKIPYFLMSESRLNHHRSFWKRLVKYNLVRWAVKNAAGCFPTGTLAEEYLLHYGARKETMAHIPNAPDVAAIREEVEDYLADRDNLRKEYGIPDRPAALFAGRLIRKKGVHLLIEAISGAANGVDLIILGDGPERQGLEKLSHDLGVEERIHFKGFVEPKDMTKWYAMADFFVLPSSETWGVVVSEALAAGLPVIVSDQVGCYPDVINDERIGQIVRYGNVDDFRSAIENVVKQQVVRENVMEIWKNVFNRMQYSHIANQFVHNLKNYI